MAPVAIGIGTAINVGMGLWGASKASKAAKDQARAANAAAQRRLVYDTAMWQSNRSKLIADRDYAAETVAIQARNEGKSAAWRDATNLSRYNYDLQIRNAKQSSLEQQYLRSEGIYTQQTDLNQESASAGVQDEYNKLKGIDSEANFNVQEANIEQLLAEGKMRAMGSSGRSAAKGIQSSLADYGRRLSMVNESLVGARRNTRSVLNEIGRDKTSANLAAYAARMLKPGQEPMPIIPYATPLTEWQLPRELESYDFGPSPVLGATQSVSAAANRVWGSAITSIGSSIGSGLMAASGGASGDGVGLFGN